MFYSHLQTAKHNGSVCSLGLYKYCYCTLYDNRFLRALGDVFICLSRKLNIISHFFRYGVCKMQENLLKVQKNQL